jgi:hypothetical protein
MARPKGNNNLLGPLPKDAKYTVPVRIAITRKPGRDIFEILHTPEPLWVVLPGISRTLSVSDYANEVIYKRFDFKYKGCEYEFVFYLQPEEPFKGIPS